MLPQTPDRPSSFQFLIGTLKTALLSPVCSDNLLFQFLIGTLKTIQAHSFHRIELDVSIPHRYAENQSCIRGMASDTGFQFLIGTLKTRICHTCIFAAKSVSIPHRYAENEDGQDVNLVKKEFQFLIGTLKTLHLLKILDFPLRFQFLIGTLKTQGSPGSVSYNFCFNSS